MRARRQRSEAQASYRSCGYPVVVQATTSRGMVGERCARRRSRTARTGGARTRANAGMSSEMGVRTTHTASLRVPGQRQSSQGESGPKPRTSSRRRWQAGRKVLHQKQSLRVKRGRDREREPIEWTGSVATVKRVIQANPDDSTVTGGTSLRKGAEVR